MARRKVTPTAPSSVRKTSRRRRRTSARRAGRSRARHGAAVAGRGRVAAAAGCGAGARVPVAAAVDAGDGAGPALGGGALEHGELVAEGGDRVAGAVLPAVLQVGRQQHCRPDQPQDDKNQQGRHASVAVLRTSGTVVGAWRASVDARRPDGPGSWVQIRRSAAHDGQRSVVTVVLRNRRRSPLGGLGPPRSGASDARGRRRRGRRAAAGRCRSGPRSSPRGRRRRSPCCGRPTCTCRRS